MKIILASQSPRRKALLSLITSDFEVIVSNVDETFIDGLGIYEQSKRLAYIKAKAIFDKTEGDRIIIGSDTIVYKDGIVYGKPKDKEEAIKMLDELKNDKNEVITSLAVLIQEGNDYNEYIDYDTSYIYIDNMTDDEILNWVNRGTCLDNAGAYAVQNEFGVHVSRIDGNYQSIVGLPIHKLYKILKNYI